MTKPRFPWKYRGALAASLLALAYPLTCTVALAGLTFELHLYRTGQGESYGFYTPLYTNATAPAAPLGTYLISSPHQPTNGSNRAFQLTTNGLNLVSGQEYAYGDFASALFQITNGSWQILFTNSTTTNLYTFSVTAPSLTSSMLPATLATVPTEGAALLSRDTNYSWQPPSGWSSGAFAQAYNYKGFYQHSGLPPGQSSWNPASALPVDNNCVFSIQYLTTNSVFFVSTPLDTNNAQPISGWDFTSVLESSSSVNFAVLAARGAPSSGHTCLAYYSFEDDNLISRDFSGNNNNIEGYSWLGAPPNLVTNDAESGLYSVGFTGAGWLSPPTNLLATLAGSFSISVWLKSTNVHGSDLDDQYNAAGIVSALSGNYYEALMPMAQTGGKLAFYTGGSLQNLLRSKASINTGQYVHAVVTRDQQTGEKRIYINGALDASVFSDVDRLTGPDLNGLDIGMNNGQGFVGVMDEIQLYSGVLSSADVAFLYSHPGTNVADTFEFGLPVARLDFENANSPGLDSSGRNNSADCSSNNGGQGSTSSSEAIIGSFARQFFGNDYLCFSPSGSEFPNVSNALSGSFTLTGWVMTTNSVNTDSTNAYYGQPIWFEYSSGIDQAIVSITGSKAAFTVGNPNGGSDTTLHSASIVNDGHYHFIAATRDQASGAMNLFVDGILQATGLSTNGARPVTSSIRLAGGYAYNYIGVLDDARIYSAALNADEISLLSGHPSFNSALATTGLSWGTSGATSWFTETTNTYGGCGAAAQSGSVTNSQSTMLSVTVTGPGTLSFAWSSIANDPNAGLDYEFYVDDPMLNDIADLYGTNPWQQVGPINIPAGQHTLGWIVYANGDADASQAAFLDQVNYVSLTSPPLAVRLLNPVATSTNFQFQFTSQIGFTHTVQYRTNLVAGADWQTYTNVAGDALVKTLSLPLSAFSPARQGFVRVYTH